ncbi:MAG: exodeoxyribonuclease VII large subunit [Peptococcaceae bacterium]|nr:exodeoxyribonuclease VII large subunit [Peptococcaceae bacterium]
MRTLTVAELTRHIKALMESDGMLASFWIKGEISNYRPASSGHIYFTLKDDFSSIRSVFFRSKSARLLFNPENGMSVRIRGYVSLYERDGSYQLYVEEMEPDGLGALHLAFEQLKAKLYLEGLFDADRKKTIPWLPKTVGIVTSPTGAAVRDIIEIISRRWPGMKIIIKPVSVQGDSSSGEISRAIGMLNQHKLVDVIIVGRGGGSIEELWSFNTEEVARSIGASSIPVISAVGHETDYTIADMVADLRAPTPSAAAELAVPVKNEVCHIIERYQLRMARAVDDRIANNKLRLDNCLQSQAFRRPVENICGTRGLALDYLISRFLKTTDESINKQESIFNTLVGQLNALSPLATMSRGYSICKDEKSGEIIRNSNKLTPGDILRIDLHKGRLRCRFIESIEN